MTAARRIPTVAGATSSSTSLIDRYAGRADHATVLRYASPDGHRHDMVLLDSTERAEPLTFPNGAAMWHVLWVRDEANATVIVGTGQRRWSIAPGDTIGVPRGATLTATGGQLAVAVAVAGQNIEIAPPTHGTERYVGYNRLTEAFRIGTIRLRRWKLTEPLALADHYAAPATVLALARPMVIRAAGVVDRLTQGEAALIDPVTAPIAMPDGLGYLLTIDDTGT